jgi:hypothetical protein
VRGIIIDANIAKSCADPARHETSEACLRLTQVLAERGSEVFVALTPKLEEEWIKHGTRTFMSWWALMESRRRVRTESDKRIADYHRAIDEIDDDGIRDLLEKDAHLVELAMHKHHAVASQDDKQIRHVRTVSSSYPLLKTVQWFNPVTSAGWEDWVRGGCDDRVSYACTPV